MAATPDIRPVGDLPDAIGKTAARELSRNGIMSLQQVADHSERENSWPSTASVPRRSPSSATRWRRRASATGRPDRQRPRATHPAPAEMAGVQDGCSVIAEGAEAVRGLDDSRENLAPMVVVEAPSAYRFLDVGVLPHGRASVAPVQHWADRAALGRPCSAGPTVQRWADRDALGRP